LGPRWSFDDIACVHSESLARLCSKIERRTPTKECALSILIERGVLDGQPIRARRGNIFLFGELLVGAREEFLD
jgi:hypothetical protein